MAPLAGIRPHEEVDPLRVDRLAGRIEAEGAQLNPVICLEDLSGELVLLDGATRVAALGRLGLSYAVTHIVDERTVALERWHHVIRGASPGDVIAHIETASALVLAPQEAPPSLTTPEGERLSVYGYGLSPFSVLHELVHAYMGLWKVSRVTDDELDIVPERFPDWSAVVQYPTLTMGDVLKAALGDDLLPAGITRFRVPNRAMRISAPLSILREPGSVEEKQRALDRLVQARARTGRIRHYENGVVLFDE